MTLGSIRFRLTAWYFLSVALILILFAVGARFAMQASVYEAVDDDLRTRVRSVSQFLDHQMNSDPADLIDEMDEYAKLGVGGSLLQICDENGRALYRSVRLIGYQLCTRPQPSPDNQIEYKTQSGLRIASRSVTVKGKLFGVQVAEPMHEFQESMQRFATILLISVPVFLLIATLGGFWLSSRALAPVARITRDAQLITIGNLSRRLQVPDAKDELRRLTETLNDMLDRIERSVAKMVQFTADASHELRAPLTVIHTAADYSLRRERGPEELLDAMQKIARESARTNRLVDDLLVLARADSGIDDLSIAQGDLTAVARDAYEQVLTLASPKQIEVSLEVPSKPVLVHGDEHALGRLLLILLDNAVKYTPSGGRISLQVRASDSHAEVVVTDTGIGIAPEDLPQIYDRFWRADKVRSRNLGGAGLGLSIARWIVERHRGAINARSEVGRGSTFTVQLPYA